MSATIKMMGIGSVTASAGSLTVLLGDMADLSAGAWAILTGVVALSITAGSLAALGHIETSPTITDAGRRAARVRAATVLLAQFLIGMVVAAQASGSLIIVIPACLAIGWSGSAFLKRLAEKSGFTDKE